MSRALFLVSMYIRQNLEFALMTVVLQSETTGVPNHTKCLILHVVALNLAPEFMAFSTADRFPYYHHSCLL